MNHTDPQGMFFKSCQRPSKVIRQILPTQRKLVGLRFFFLSACVSSCRWSRALWARPASDSVWLHLRVCGSQEPVGAAFIFINSLISVIITKHLTFWFVFPPRMCEYVDHLHEHFTSPVVIQDAHYMPPKARNWLGSQSALLWKKKQLCVVYSCWYRSFCSLISGSRLFLWDAGGICEPTWVPWRRHMETGNKEIGTVF